MLYPLVFQPIFMERIWGGRELERLYGKALPPGKKIGESWEISDRADAQSVVRNGPLAGTTLHEVVERHREALMGKAPLLNGRFPLLVKILDAREKLSLQVHPPEVKAAALGGEPKTEMWYITEAEVGAELYVGLKKGMTRAQFERGIREGTVAEAFHKVTVRAGDAMFLPSGRVHAIGAGLVLFEIQQNSDTTYRVFDWNRLDDQGKPRQLHIEQSLECIDFGDFEPNLVPAGADCDERRLVEHALFKAGEISLGSGDQRVIETEARPVVVAVVSGEVEIGNPRERVQLRGGEFCLLPAELEGVAMLSRGETRILWARS